jgi:hypothetical protein
LDKLFLHKPYIWNKAVFMVDVFGLDTIITIKPLPSPISIVQTPLPPPYSPLPPLSPMPPPSDARKEECCDCQQKRDLALVPPKIDGGGVVCCDGEKVSCSWMYKASDDQRLTNGQAIINFCVIKHEDAHHDDVPDCPKVTGVSRPPLSPATFSGRLRICPVGVRIAI